LVLLVSTFLSHFSQQMEWSEHDALYSIRYWLIRTKSGVWNMKFHSNPHCEVLANFSLPLIFFRSVAELMILKNNVVMISLFTFHLPCTSCSLLSRATSFASPLRPLTRRFFSPLVFLADWLFFAWSEWNCLLRLILTTTRFLFCWVLFLVICMAARELIKKHSGWYYCVLFFFIQKDESRTLVRCCLLPSCPNMKLLQPHC
jgi:hypothetical protein